MDDEDGRKRPPFDERLKTMMVLKTFDLAGSPQSALHRLPSSAWRSGEVMAGREQSLVGSSCLTSRVKAFLPTLLAEI